MERNGVGDRSQNPGRNSGATSTHLEDSRNLKSVMISELWYDTVRSSLLGVSPVLLGHS